MTPGTIRQESPAAAAAAKCEGCDRDLGFIEALYWQVCMDCTRRRARAATTDHRCHCRAKNRQKTCQAGRRRWTSCLRCLGTIRQLTDAPRGDR